MKTYLIIKEDSKTGEMQEINRFEAYIKFKERKIYQSAMNWLYNLHNDLSGDLLSKTTFISNGFLYYIAVDKVKSTVNDAPHNETEFIKWKNWYKRIIIKNQFSEMFINSRSGIFMSVKARYNVPKSSSLCQSCNYYNFLNILSTH